MTNKQTDDRFLRFKSYKTYLRTLVLMPRLPDREILSCVGELRDFYFDFHSFFSLFRLVEWPSLEYGRAGVTLIVCSLPVDALVS